MKMMLMFIVLLYSLIVFAGDEIGNGAGLYQNRMTDYYNRLGGLIENSLPDDFNETEIKFYQDIQKLLELNIGIVFKAEDESFFIEGEYKVAYTFEDLASPIYINLDKVKIISMKDIAKFSVSLFIHELGHKLGIKDHYLLDQYGSTLANNLIEDIDLFYLNGPSRDEYIEVIYFFNTTVQTQIYYHTINKTYSLNIYLQDVINNSCHSLQVLNFYPLRETNEVYGEISYICEDARISYVQIAKQKSLSDESIYVRLY